MTKNHHFWPKSQKSQKPRFWPFFFGAPRDPPGAKKKASLSNRRIGTRNTDSHMVSIQKCQKSTLRFRACARPFLGGRIRAKIKFFFELFQKWPKNRIFGQNLTFFHDFLPFSALFAISTKTSILAYFRPFLALFSNPC